MHVRLDRHLVLYGLIGVSGVAIDFFSYTIMIELLGVHFRVANLISVSLGICNNFLLNFFVNFRMSGKLLQRFAGFFLVGISGLLLSDVFLNLLVNTIRIPPVISKALVLPVVVFGQYVANRNLTFRGFDKKG